MSHDSLGRPGDAKHYAERATAHLQHAGEDNLELAAALGLLASVHQQLGEFEKAMQARRRQVDLLEPAATDTTWVLALMEVGDLYRFQGRFTESQSAFDKALAQASPTEHVDNIPVRAAVLNAVGILYKDTFRYDAAAEAYGEAFKLMTKALGSDDPALAGIWHNLAGLALARGRPAEAVEMATRSVELREQQFGIEHHLVARDLAVLGVALLDAHRTDEAEQTLQRAMAIFHRRHPADEYELAVVSGNLAGCYLARSNTVEAERVLRDGLRIKQALLGANHPEVVRQLRNVAVVTARRPGPHPAPMR